jgi:hypothetical protein
MPLLSLNSPYNVTYNNIFFTSNNTKSNYIMSYEGNKLINFVLKNNSWLYIEKCKKHTFVEHCRNIVKNHNLFYKK